MAALAGLVVGMSKSGIKGIGILAVTLMALVFGAKSSTGVLLPMLVLADVLAVAYYNRHARWVYLARLLPWIAIGVLVGVWAGQALPPQAFRQGMAVVVAASVGLMLWWERGSHKIPDSRPLSIAMGLVVGFATMIGNLAGAFSNIYFLATKLPKNEFIGTAAWLFLIVNLFKMPFHVFVWHTIDLDALWLSVRLFPAVVGGFAGGMWLVGRIRDQRYRQLVMLLTVVGAVLIFLG